MLVEEYIHHTCPPWSDIYSAKPVSIEKWIRGGICWGVRRTIPQELRFLMAISRSLTGFPVECAAGMDPVVVPLVTIPSFQKPASERRTFFLLNARCCRCSAPLFAFRFARLLMTSSFCVRTWHDWLACSYRLVARAHSVGSSLLAIGDRSSLRLSAWLQHSTSFPKFEQLYTLWEPWMHPNICEEPSRYPVLQ